MASRIVPTGFSSVTNDLLKKASEKQLVIIVSRDEKPKQRKITGVELQIRKDPDVVYFTNVPFANGTNVNIGGKSGVVIEFLKNRGFTDAGIKQLETFAIHAGNVEGDDVKQFIAEKAAFYKGLEQAKKAEKGEGDDDLDANMIAYLSRELPSCIIVAKGTKQSARKSTIKAVRGETLLERYQKVGDGYLDVSNIDVSNPTGTRTTIKDKVTSRTKAWGPILDTSNSANSALPRIISTSEAAFEAALRGLNVPEDMYNYAMKAYRARPKSPSPKQSKGKVQNTNLTVVNTSKFATAGSVGQGSFYSQVPDLQNTVPVTASPVPQSRLSPQQQYQQFGMVGGNNFMSMPSGYTGSF